MSAWSSIRLVAVREIKERGRSKPFIITSIITALLVIGIIVVPGLFGDDTATYEIGAVGDGNTRIIETAEVLANANDEEGSAPSVALEEIDYESRDDAEQALTDGDVDAVLIDGEEVVLERQGGLFASDGPAGILQQAAGAIALQEVIAEAGESAEEVVQVMTSDSLETSYLVESDEDTDAASIVAYFGLLILYMAIILYGTWILTGVTEEKSNRVVEVIISTIRPWQLLGGKILGIGALAMTQFIGTILLAFVGLRLFGSFDLPEVPAEGLVNLAIWFVLGFLLYSVLFGAAGSLVGRVEDAQSAAMPMTLFSVIGFFAGFAVLNDADGPIAILTTFFPFTAPFTVPIRVSLNAIPFWQYGASVVITIATIYLAVRVAGRIYAGGILRSGSRTKLREAWRSAEG